MRLAKASAVLDYPGFVPRALPEISGDDPLGMAPVNERLYGSVFPGINNVVQYIRVYSALCWMLMRIDEYLKSHKLKQLEAKRVHQQALEKIQNLLTWSNTGFGVGGMAGATRNFPLENRKVPLLFETFGTNRASYLDAVQYRPSLTTGLGFLEVRDHLMFGCLPAGKVLAEAFDESAQSHPDYKWLANVTDLEATPAKVAKLRNVLDLREPSEMERSVFLAQYFSLARPDDLNSPQAHRRASLILVLRVIAACKRESISASESEIRASMARGASPEGVLLDLTGVELEQQWWAVLQLRQLQRLAFDSLEAILERWLDICVHQSLSKSRSIAAICADFDGHISDYLGDDGAQPLSYHLDKVARLQGKLPTLYLAGLKKSPTNIFEIIEDLLATGLEPEAGGEFPVLPKIFHGLLVCVIEARNLAKNQNAEEAVADGVGQGSLLELSLSAAEFSSQPAGKWIAHLLHHWVINRHFEVVTIRSQNADGKNRFRFLIGDSGLQRFDMSLRPSTVGLAQDRLRHALLLLAQGGLIRLNKDGYVLTAQGRKRLTS
jgi:hypothetical protein